MGIFELIFFTVFTFICGALCTLLIEFYIFKKYLYSGPKVNLPKGPSPPGNAMLPEELLFQIGEEKPNFNSGSPRHSLSQGNENLAINLTLQFLFNELRNAERVRLWFYRKLNNEFKELLTQSTIGKFFESMKLRDLNLGDHFPTIKGLDVADAKICAYTGLLESLDLCLDLHYSGNFQMSIDLKMVLGKSAYLSLQVKRLSGKARLQFTRVPYTHWSLSFYSEPVLELEVHSQFQGRQLQPQIISLITGQIRRAIRRKHTLPRYKLRYKPFFRRLNDENIDLTEVQLASFTPGYLDVTLLEVSRLNIENSLKNVENLTQIEVFCTMSVDSTPWVQLTQYNGIPYMVLDLSISKVTSQQLGVVFKQEHVVDVGQSCVLVETIVPGSPASIAELRKGDIVLAVNSKKVSNMNQVAKLIKNASQRRFIIRVERKYVLADNDLNILSKFETESLPEKNVLRKSVQSESSLLLDDNLKSVKFYDLKDSDPNIYDLSDGTKLRRRKSSSFVSEETLHTPDTPSKQMIRNVSNTSIVSYFTQPYNSNEPKVLNINNLYFTTEKKDYSSVISFSEQKKFYIQSELQYLNIGIWTKIKENEDLPSLLGYINAPIKLILAKCSTSSTGYYLKYHPLMPPDSGSTNAPNHKLYGYSGFDQTLCYGDILLSYTWVKNQTKQQNNLDGNIKKEESNLNKSQTSSNEEITDRKTHDFIRTHFYRATHCDFCTKKIWLKDAVQCRNCAMVCHKKCESRCQATVPCNAEPTSTIADETDEMDNNIINNEGGPEISLTSCDENNQSSLAAGLGISPELLEGAESSVASTLMAGELDDGLMSKAKETGRYLYKEMEPLERVEKINLMISKLKTSLDKETTSRLELSQSADPESGNLIIQSDLRVQALSVLLLHYCTGLQDAQEILDRPNIYRAE